MSSCARNRQCWEPPRLPSTCVGSVRRALESSGCFPLFSSDPYLEVAFCAKTVISSSYRSRTRMTSLQSINPLLPSSPIRRSISLPNVDSMTRATSRFLLALKHTASFANSFKSICSYTFPDESAVANVGQPSDHLSRPPSLSHNAQ